MKTLLTLLCIGALLGACAPQPAPVSPVQPATAGAPDIQAQAEAEATAIVQRARATVLVQQAQAQAAAILQAASSPTAPPTLASPANAPTDPLETQPAIRQAGDSAGPPPGAETASGAVIKATAPPEGAPAVEIISAGFSAEGGFISITYRASPQIASTFWPGRLSIIDEATGTVYNEVPVMPLIGPLIGRPVEAGQSGYVMFVNTAPGLAPRSLVTVVLGDYTFEHILVE